MSYLPIAALLARDAVKEQFREGPEQQRRGAAAEQPAPGRLRLAGARALRRLADRLEPRSLSPRAAPPAPRATHRGSPC
jgi:hypothetical protein